MEEYVFPFTDRRALQSQDREICDRLYDDFWERLLAADPSLGLPKERLAGIKDSVTKLEWIPAYASVILLRKLDSRYSTITLLGLDCWKSAVHASINGRESIAVPDVSTPAHYPLGRILSTNVETVLEKFQAALNESEANNTGNRRGQSAGHQGNQKTPSFARTVLYQTMVDLDTKPAIQGGTTDCGLHTGCIRRNTSFPIVLSVVHELLKMEGESDDELFLKCVTTYLLSYLVDIGSRVNSFEPVQFNRIITIIRVMEGYLRKIQDRSFKETVVGAIEKQRAHLDNLRPGKDLVPDVLELDESVEETCQGLRAPTFPSIPNLSGADDSQSRLARAKSDAKKNLGYSDLLSYKFTGKLQDTWIQIMRLNEFFWGIATQLEYTQADYDISDLREKLKCFSEHISFARSESLKTPHVMTVVLASEELLAYWICFCWAHYVAERKHPLFEQYGGALDPADLEHIALSDARSHTAVTCVRRFLGSRLKPCRPFRVKDDTRTLARHYGLQWESLDEIYSQELAEANRLIEERWRKVETAQRELAVLDSELKIAKAELAHASDRRQRSESRDYDYNRRGYIVYHSVYHEYVEEENRCQTKVNHLKTNISRLEQKPASLPLGLPRSRDLALEWLFFIFMPKEFRDVAALAQLAQSKLWKVAPETIEPTQDLLTWFLQNRKKSSYNANLFEFRLGTHAESPRSSTPGIREYARETGVFFPDPFSVDPYWHSTDPFASGRTAVETTVLFTELLPPAHESDFMQNFVPMLPSSTRENLSIARREKKPNWLSHEQYLAFANLRAGPYAQVRCLVEALHDNLLPFQHECVHVLVKQLLYHIGDGWKIDLDVDWNGFCRIVDEMNRQHDLLRDSPKDCDRVLIFGVMSSFFGQQTEDLRICARKFASICRRWADDVGREVNSSDRMSPALYWKQSKLYGYALLCFSFGKLEDADYKKMAELIVLFRSKALFASELSESGTLDQPILRVMATHMPGMLKTISRCTEHLSTCLSLVLDNAPSGLVWTSVKYRDSAETGCFEAYSGDWLYSINLLNGTLLVEGVPPGTLPSSVVEDPLYRRTFQRRNFEMIVLGFRRYQAARLVDGHFQYEFLIDSTETLHIFEHDVSSKESLLLLRRESIDAPPLLRECHSHWYSETHKCVVLRKPSYRNREVDYIINNEATYSILPRYRSLPLGKIAAAYPNYECLLLGANPLSDPLEYFEFEYYVHMFVNPERTQLRFTLPRFKLSFLLSAQRVRSIEFNGFRMKDRRVLEDTLPELETAIVLSHPDGREKVLIPDGVVPTQTEVETPENWDAELSFHIYDVHHRFRHLIAGTTAGRLQLASLYASLGCAVSDRRMEKPASMIACELVRQSWKNEPLTQAEKSKLVELSGHSNLSCTLRLLCTWLWASSHSVAFLHGHDVERCPELEFDMLALDEYKRNFYAHRLMPGEEATLLGTRQPERLSVSLAEREESATIAFVRETERKLRDTYVVETRSGVSRFFPLERPSHCTGLELQVYEEMEESHRRFYRLPKRKIEQYNRTKVKNIFAKVRRRRERIELSLLRMFRQRDLSPNYRVSLASGRIDCLTSLDILRIVSDDSMAELHSMFLDKQKCRDLRLQGVDWAALCVLEDKLQRILRIDLDEDSHSVLQELESVREWRPTLHPRWIAFEVEQNLQIRPNQYSIVRQLLENPNSVIQLNMGLGKTRVLVPMLILECISSQKISRVNMLPSIVSEAMEYYRTVLVASVQHVKLFALPFHRDIPLDEALADQLSDEIAKCKEHRGSFVVTAQQRNSLLLKQYDEEVFVEGLKEAFLDILDESDAILDFNFQLVYALGAQVQLPAGPSRWMVVQALLTVLARSESKEITSILEDSDKVHTEMSKCGSFPKIRMLLPFLGHEHELGTALVRQLVAGPPHEFRWMLEVPREEVDLLVTIMSDSSFRESSEVIESNALFKEHESHILAARGFIAYGLLIHGLEARYRVTYGLNPGSKTMMAVPYAASDTPKLRSQYSHPDMCIVYTALSYFHQGLSEPQLKEALVELQSMGVQAQKAIYGEWIRSIRRDLDVSPQVIANFDDPNKVDVNNVVQFDLIYKHLKNCMEVISFWTNNFVYPTDTCQFPKKRATSAWNVCDSGNVIGFSGTDDNRFLLPLSVEQMPQEESHLRATNGEMVMRILDCSENIHLLNDNFDGPMWQQVLEECASLSVHALIDVAGLMAGSQNESVAHFLAERLDKERFRGIVYFDTNSCLWTVYETENHRSVVLGSSSYTESECFVYFDESRCRGSDMKLQTNAVALVTLEPKMTKDKFLQGCARMRKLRHDGQSLILAGTSEVVSAETTTKQVLEKILHRTATTTKQGVVSYCHRGLQYYQFPTAIEDDISLQTMYSNHIPHYSELGEFLDATYERDHLVQEEAQDLVEYCKVIGGGLPVNSYGLSEECEQELEHEVEHEEEEEMAIDRQDPYSQDDWEFERAFSDPESLFRNGFFVPIDAFIREKVNCLAAIDWSRANIFCTPNFLRTIQAFESSVDLSLYLRPVNAVLVVPNGTLVLISAYELDKLLPIWWKVRKKSGLRSLKKVRKNGGLRRSLKSTKVTTLQHLFTLISEQGFGRDTVSTSDENMAFVKVFRGHVQFTEREQEILGEALRNVPESHLVVQELLGMRGRLSHYDRSDLEIISTRFYQ